MSQQNLEIVRQIYEQWGRGDFGAGRELYDPYVLLVLRPEFPDAGSYCGPQEIRQYMREDFLADLDGPAIAGPGVDVSGSVRDPDRKHRGTRGCAESRRVTAWAVGSTPLPSHGRDRRS